MYRLVKQGIVRETESRLEADALQHLGYALEEAGTFLRPAAGLEERSVKELYELCRAHGLEIPKGTRKDGLLALLKGDGGGEQ